MRPLKSLQLRDESIRVAMSDASTPTDPEATSRPVALQ
jgi:hypothetical protein